MKIAHILAALGALLFTMAIGAAAPPAAPSPAAPAPRLAATAPMAPSAPPVISMPPLTTPAPATTAAAPQAWPTFGLALGDPPGFRRMAEGAPNRIAQWMRRPPQSTTDITSLIYIEVEAAGGRTLKDYLAITALMNNGKMLVDPLAIDHAPAFEIIGTVAYKPFAGRKFIVTQHEDQFYVISILETVGDNCDAAAAALCASIKWLKIEDTAAHLAELGPEPVTIFNRIQLQIPAAMRSGIVENSATRSHWALLNLKTNRDELTLDFQLAVFDHRNTFADVRVGYGQTLQKRFGLNADIIWKPLRNAGGLDIWLTDPVEIVASGADKKEHITPVRWALVDVHTHVIVIVFNLGNRTLEQARAYNAAAEQIAGTIALVDSK